MSDSNPNLVLLNVSNLYARNGRVINMQDGTQLLVRTPLVWVAGDEDSYYKIKSGDTLDLITYKYYGGVVDDPEHLWWLLADANNIFNPMDISYLIGAEILIPNIANLPTA